MTIIQAIILGIIQGLTEFLPVSSSGHLALGEHLLGVAKSQDVGFEVAVHAGTLLAVFIYFRTRIMNIFGDLLKWDENGKRWTLYIIIGTIPAGVVGLLVKDTVESLFQNMQLVGVAWVCMALILFVSEKLAKPHIDADRMGVWRALWIGIAQAVAIIPGISRSGSTISAGLLSGVNKQGVVEFTFILSIPIVTGAILLTILDWSTGEAILSADHFIGALAAAVSGYFAIALMLKVVNTGKLFWFAVYCGVLGIATLIFI